MNRGEIAALIRGLCIEASGKPQWVIHREAAGAEVPRGAMVFSTGEHDGDEAAADSIRAAYTAWKKDRETPAEILLPSCAALCDNGKPIALYWIDNDGDAARKRLSENNATPHGAAPYRAAPVGDGILINAAERADVLKNRIALVTGGAQGIGEEIVRNLAAAGAFVYIADLNCNGARALADDINAAEKRTAACAIEVNVSDEASVTAMFNTVMETSGGLDLCISNAGVLRAGSVLEQDIADFKLVTDINYTAFFIIVKHAGKFLRLQHITAPRWKTDIIQINSKSGLEGSNRNGAYSGGKFGGLGLTASFALELVDYHIKVNAICPGNFLDGPLWSDPEKGLFVQYLKTGKVPGAQSIADVRAFYEAKVPMKRGCTGKDLARAIFYLVEQEYETGQALPVTGGQVMLH